MHRAGLYERFAKRPLDAVGAAIGLILLSPLLAGVAVVVRLTLGRPILFRQPRIGLDGREFTIVKFRTMRNDGQNDVATDASRLTPFGRWLRATSLDELPELWNVLRGDMGFVGPRPLLVQYLPRYSQEQARRHEVRPGVTGWAQVNGRNALTWPEKFRLDVYYVDRVSAWFDLRILIATATQVLRRRGIAEDGQATMREFRG